jgi:hypothetical protein
MEESVIARNPDASSSLPHRLHPEHGFTVSDRGRIPIAVTRAYLAGDGSS